MSARLRLGEIDRTIQVSEGEKAAVFEVELQSGPARLQTWLEDDEGVSRGAYYVYVERL